MKSERSRSDRYNALHGAGCPAAVSVKPVLDRAAQFAEPIAGPGDDASFTALRAAEQTGRPLGTADFIAGLERLLGRRIARRAPGRKPAERAAEKPALL